MAGKRKGRPERKARPKTRAKRVERSDVTGEPADASSDVSDIATEVVGGDHSAPSRAASPERHVAKKSTQKPRPERSDRGPGAKKAPRDEDRDERASDPPAVREPAKPSALLRSWWMVGVFGLVLAYVVYTHLKDRETEGDGEALAPVDVESQGPRAERLRVQVINRFHHETDAFTQGLLFHEGFLYESTGQRRHSSLRRVDLETGEVLQRRAMDDRIFAEGLTLVGDELYQLTWTSHEAQVYRLEDFEPIRTYEYTGQGWGLCYDGTHLVMSNGSDRLAFRDPVTFEEVRSVRVVQDGHPRDQLNELECVDGVVWANVWQTDEIVRIDPASGLVTAVVDASGLLSTNEGWVADVLNGIAWVPSRGHFVITGKYWPYLFEVDFVPDTDADADDAEDEED